VEVESVVVAAVVATVEVDAAVRLGEVAAEEVTTAIASWLVNLLDASMNENASENHSEMRGESIRDEAEVAVVAPARSQGFGGDAMLIRSMITGSLERFFTRCCAAGRSTFFLAFPTDNRVAVALGC